MTELNKPGTDEDVFVKGWECGPLGVNCYLIGSAKDKEAVIVDPGFFEEAVLKYIKEETLTPKLIIATHTHLDHILAIPEIKSRFDVEFTCHESDLPLLSKPDPLLKGIFGTGYKAVMPDWTLHDGDKIKIGSHVMTVIHTPGHTPGSICLLLPPYLFTGDTLFQAGIGRTDLEGGDYSALINSLKNRLMSLPDDLIIFPGHGYSSLLGEEKKRMFYY